MSDFNAYFQDFNQRYADLLAKQDSNNLHKLLQEPVPDFDMNEHRLVASLHQQKARAYSLFAENNEMDRHFEAAINLVDDAESWKLLLDWANLYIMQLRVPALQENSESIFEQAQAIIHRADISLIRKDRYAVWAITSLSAFCELALAKTTVLPKVYQTLDYSPIPLSIINNPLKAKEFYAHFFKNIVVAIELRDLVLLNRLLKMISVDDATLMGEGTLLLKFQQTLKDAMDMRAEFAAEFNFIYGLAPVLKTRFPNLNLFISYLESQNLGGLHYFFKAIK